MLRILALVTTLQAPPATVVATPGAMPAATGVATDTLAGAWQVTLDVMGNGYTSVCTFAQDGEKLSGSCKNQENPEAKAEELSGEVKGDTIRFSHGADYQGQPLTIKYTGTRTAPTTISGTVDVSPFDVSGTFTATPAPNGSAPAKP